MVLEQGHGVVDRGGRPGDDDLLGVVVVGHHHVEPLDEGLDLVAGGRGGGHRAGVVARGLEDGVGPLLGQPQQGGLVEGAGRRQGDQLAERVPAHGLGREAERGEDPGHGQARDPEGGLGGPGVGEGVALGGPGGVVEGGAGQHRGRPTARRSTARSGPRGRR